MVSVKGDRGFLRKYEYNDGLDDTDLSPLKKAQIRYFQTEYGKQKLKECQQRYDHSDKGKLRAKRYKNKTFHCDICDIDIKMVSKTDHLK